MSEKINDGGPAFPSDMMLTKGVVSAKPYNGMSLRDWFAGQALAGLIAGYYANPDSGGLGSEEFARLVYRQADAMLSAQEASK